MFSDECHSSLAPIIGRTWAKVGETPIVKTPSQRKGVSIIGAISECGKAAVMYTKDKMNSLGFIGFLDHLLKTVDGKIALFVDNHRMHKTENVLAFVEANKERLVLEHTPCYAPECNPIEWLWSYVKGLLTMRVMPSIDALLEFWDQAINLALHLKYPAQFFANSAIGNVG
jgi:transposase